MIRTQYQKTKVCDEPLFKEPMSIQEIFSIKSIDENGIFELNGNLYSKLYTLSDMNFLGVTEEEQKAIIVSYSKVLKTIPCRFSFTVANEYVDEKEFHEKILYKLRGDNFDELRGHFNEVIKSKVTDAKQGLYQTIYLTLTLEAENMVDANSQFKSTESAIRAAFIGMGLNGMQGSVLRAVSINDRMQLLYNFTHIGSKPSYKFDFEDELRRSHDWLNVVSPSDVIFYNDYFVINGKFGRVLYCDKMPNNLDSDMVSKLSGINCTSYITVNSELLDAGDFKQELQRKHMKVGMKIESEKQRNRANNDFLADASQKLLDEKEKLDEFSKAIDSSDDHYFNTTVLMLFMAESLEELKTIQDKIDNIASQKSLKFKPCFAKQREGINSAFPFGIQEFKHVVNLSSSCLAMYVPFKTQELNDEGGTWYGINRLSNNAVIANKKKLKNHNGMILGQSGSGKSVFAKSEIISIYINQPSDQIIIIDPQSEYGPVTEIVNGTIISFDSTKEFYLNPMDVDFSGVDYGQLDEIMGEKNDFMLTLLSSLLKRELHPEETSIVDEVIRKVYSQNFAMRKRLNGEKEEESEFLVPEYMKSDESSVLVKKNLSNDEQVRLYSPTLQDVYQGLKDCGSPEGEHLAAAMDTFVNGSLNLFNHRTNVDLSNRFLVFDLSGVKENLRVTAMLIMMETVRVKIKGNAKKKLWTHLYIDEFHELLGVNKVADFVVKLWKEIRKMNGILNGITQNMSDLLENDSNHKLGAILSNTEYFAMLSQSTPDKNELMKFLPQISPKMFSYVDNADSGTGLIKMGPVTVPFDMIMPTDSKIYEIVNTDGGAFGV